MDDLSTPLPAPSDAEVQALGGAGFFVREAFLDAALALEARAEADALRLGGHLAPAGVSRGGSHRLDRSVRGDLKIWLAEPDSPPALQQVAARLASLGRAVSDAAWLGLQRHDVQLAYYDGGAAYVRHRDAFVGAESRRLTVISYLNPSWKPGEGGELRLYPADRSEPVNLAPVMGRTVVFLAESVEHEVLESFAPRYALTAWFYAR